MAAPEQGKAQKCKNKNRISPMHLSSTRHRTAHVYSVWFGQTKKFKGMMKIITLIF